MPMIVAVVIVAVVIVVMHVIMIARQRCGSRSAGNSRECGFGSAIDIAESNAGIP